MITNVRRVKSSGDIQRYVRYTIAPEEEQSDEDYVFGERTLELEADYIDIGLDVERNRTSHEITNQILEWNAEKRAGKKAPASPAVAGVIAFSIKDTEKLYTTNQHGLTYLDKKRAIEIAREAVGETMGYDRPIYLALHGDKEHLHVHFVAGLVDSHGKIWDGSTMTNDQGEKVKVRDFRQWEMTNEKLEIKHGLERVTHRKAMEHEGEHRKAQIKRASNAVVHLANKGEIALSVDLAGRLELAYTDSNKQFDKFLELSEQYGITIKPNMGTSKVNGLSFSIDGMDSFIKASDLGNRYKWTKLEKDLNYEYERDYPKLAELKATASTTSDTARPDIRTLGANQRITTIANNLNAATEAAGLGATLQPEQQHPRTSYPTYEGSSRTKTTIESDNDQPNRSNPVIEPIKQDSWNDGNGLQPYDGPRRKGRGSRETGIERGLYGMADQHSNSASTSTGADVLLQGQVNSGSSQTSAPSHSDGHTDPSQTNRTRVGQNIASAKAAIEALSNGTPEDDKAISDDIEAIDWSKKLTEAFAQQEARKQQQRNRGYSNDGISI